MRFDPTSLRSRVAGRIFSLFILCALLPLGALAVLAFHHVSGQLTAHGEQQLRQVSKAQGMSIFERLSFLDAELRLIAAMLDGVAAFPTGPSAALQADLEERFAGVDLVAADGRRRPLRGRIQTPRPLTAQEYRHLQTGRSVISTAPCGQTAPCVFMSRNVDPARPERGMLVGQIRPAYLWEVDGLPAFVDLCVLDQANRVLFCSSDPPPVLPQEALEAVRRSTAGRFRWVRDDGEYLADYWTVYLRPAFFTPRWVVVVSQARSDVLAPLANFRRLFLLITFLALWVVVLLSLTQIRRNLVPLEKLREATRRIANQDFQTRVTVTSGDEFQELAASLNVMTARLGRQFASLKAINEIDRAILSSWEPSRIVEAVLVYLRDLLPHDGVSISLLQGAPPVGATTYLRTAVDGEVRLEILLAPGDLRDLFDHPEVWIPDGREVLPPYLAPLAARGMRSFLVAPIFLDGAAAAVISLGHPVPVHSEEDVRLVRQVADQVAVALSNARLVAELRQLHWGTLTALARAIDAKSPWTSGHSERVTDLATAIARTMGLSAAELEILRRGGLLHDIGKIGTPGDILDKPGKLTEEEQREVQAHVAIGARILEPIPGFEACLPIVRQHHEWFDGSGYPEGLKGEAISLHARVLAVADTYDALVSSRPYRRGLHPEQAVEVIRKGAGTQFDPRVVEAFLQVVAGDPARWSGQRAARRSARDAGTAGLLPVGAQPAPGESR
ncbi:MAG: HD domain-containing phosphohydrolase [Armatimonadota bacterium]|nr:HD domain-containing phosphohydrolase [Armatimonadota bacterium]MDR7452331.1 HD domain-containing phosphohydrolase [Armatimonadota bacterium]MDR7467778.1 HD domain-containing phosphohydrolase [Armatimonadota bacterium]MDR7494636.1 HD domain-containing phosphohydrolase [Armatimonadota bacterium]MDR7499696.1 HD domain-containing phosphohydrolase [Armatimonadota bacterium]